MKLSSWAYLATFSGLLSGCGGGGQPLEEAITLLLASNNIDITLSQGDALPITLSGTWSASNPGTNPVYIRVKDINNNTISPATIDASNSENFALETSVNPTLPVGEHISKASVVVCKDVNCNKIYRTSEADITIHLTVKEVPEWQTHQANSSHNGYVPIWINTTHFKKLWKWSRGQSSEPIGGINAPVAGNGSVYVSTDVYFGKAWVAALDELTGSEKWRVSFGKMPALNPPAIDRDTLFVATSGHEDTKLWGINRTDGTLKFQSKFASQWANYLAPTADNGSVFQTGGYYGGYVYAFSVENGAETWSKSPGASWGMDTPAVDDSHVYAHNGRVLTVFNKGDGAVVDTLADPFGNSDYEYHGSPVIGTQNDIFAFSGGAFSGRASSNVEYYDDRVISKYDIKEGQYKLVYPIRL